MEDVQIPGQRVVVMGTCRVTRSVGRMHRPGVTAVKVSHRFHTARQLVRALRYLAGEDVFPRDLTHTISRLSLETLVNDPNPFDTLEQIRAEAAPLREADAFVIEVSAPKDHFATAEGHGEILVNSMVWADVPKYADHFAPYYARGELAPLSNYRTEVVDGDHVRQQMRLIKNYLQKPILWVAYANIDDPAPNEVALQRMRAKMSDWVARGARSMGDPFYDPSVLAREHGRAWLFADGGKDLQHYTAKAQAALGPILMDKLGFPPI